MTINIFVLKGDLNGENRSSAFLFLLGILRYSRDFVITKSDISRFEIHFSNICRVNA